MPIADTSRLSYQELLATLPRRERAVWHALQQCSEPPTAYELMLRMDVRDPNLVRPRLTEMADKGCVQRLTDGKRKCKVTGRLAYTWAVVREPQPAARRLW